MENARGEDGVGFAFEQHVGHVLEIARAVATDPQLILLDEAMAGLRPTETDEVIGMVRKLSDSGIAILLGGVGAMLVLKGKWKIVAAVAGNVDPSGVPHSTQKSSPGSTALPQPGQVSPRRAPQRAQDFAPTLLTVPQDPQFTVACSLRWCTVAHRGTGGEPQLLQTTPTRRAPPSAAAPVATRRVTV